MTELMNARRSPVRPVDEPVRRAPIPVTDREREVLDLLIAGMSYAQISRSLFISRKTVGYHLSNLYAKTHTRGRHELTLLVRMNPGLLEDAADGRRERARGRYGSAARRRDRHAAPLSTRTAVLECATGPVRSVAAQAAGTAPDLPVHTLRKP